MLTSNLVSGIPLLSSRIWDSAGLRKLSQTITTIRINQYLLRFLQDFPLLTALTGRAPKELVCALFKTQK